jgi:hypothetical protein
LTWMRPEVMSASPERREATPASARNFCRRILGHTFGLAQAGDAVAFLPFTSFFKDCNALKAFEHVTFDV